MNVSRRNPELSFLVPAANENRWSDLLATLIATDPAPMAEMLGVEFDTVRREVAVPSYVARKSDRLDLLLLRNGAEVAAIEVKLLSGLGPQQLERYLLAFPRATVYRVLHLARLPVHLGATGSWASLTWETVLSAYAGSANPWVSATASAWTRQLDALVPSVGADTIWNDVPDDAAGLELALRVRIAWLANRLDSWCDLDHDIVPSSGGGNWAVRMWAPTSVAGHFLTAEIQEGLTAYEWKPNPDKPYRDRLPGPVVLLGLRQDETTTSADFNWTLLRNMFAQHVVDENGQPRDDRAWHTSAARPTHPVDQQNWRNIVDAGAPRWLGKGWGMKVAEGTGSCLFGARFGLPPDSTLGEIEVELQRLPPLLRRMAT